MTQERRSPGRTLAAAALFEDIVGIYRYEVLGAVARSLAVRLDELSGI